MLYVFILAPLVILAVTKILYPHQFELKEMIAQFLIVLFLMGTSFALEAGFSDTNDYEVWNGEVTDKTVLKEYCPSGWVDSTDWFCTEYSTRTVDDGPRKCSKDSNGKKSCYQPTKTQYNYDYDWEQKWYVATNVGEIYIRRVDSQGADMPPSWRDTNIGDPASTVNHYKNWVRAASNSLFHKSEKDVEKYKDLIPAEYPIALHDYFKINRVLLAGVKIDNVQEWNFKLSVALKDLGPKRQMNAVIVMVDANKAGLDYAHAVRNVWRGFKKNDAVLFIGVSNNTDIAWAESLSWTKNSEYDVRVRNEVTKANLNVDEIVGIIYKNGMQYYERRPMKDFEFLKDEIPTPTWAYILYFVVGVLGSLGLSYFFVKN